MLSHAARQIRHAASTSKAAVPSFRSNQAATDNSTAKPLGSLQSFANDLAELGKTNYARPGSLVYQTQQKQLNRAEQVQSRKLFDGKALQPGDLSYKRMYPSLTDRNLRSTLTTTSLGPSKTRAQLTDWYIQRGDLDPLKEPLNVRLQSKFVTNIGKIMNRAQTQLTWRNQRRMGKAVRRARAMGVIPYFADWSSTYQRTEKADKFGMAKLYTD